tara:strand:+ start:1596 stop:3197 length:1602 start_codon:yes stop_codon:yes gene_type:complete
MAKIIKATQGLLKLLDGDVSIQRLIDAGFLDSALKKDPSVLMQKNIIDAATKRYKEARKNNPYFDEREKIAESNEFKTNFVETDLKRNIITPEDLKIGDTLMPIMGDKTLHGTSNMIGGVPTNVKAEAGADFVYTNQLGNNPGWRSNIGGATPVQKRAGLLQQETGNAPLAMYVNMGDEATNFTTPIVQNLIQEIKDRPITPAMAKLFDEGVRRYYKGGQGRPPFLGINHPDFENQVMGVNGFANIGEIRKAIYKAMKLKPVQESGFPNPDQVIAAVNDPRLGGPELYRAGRSMFRTDPEKPVVYNRDNSGYTYEIPAKLGEEASLDTSYSMEEMFRDAFKNTSLRKTGDNNPNITTPPQPLSTNQARKAIITNTNDPNMSQKVDQELVDNLMTIREKNLNRRMFAGGGSSAGLLSGIEGESQAPTQDYEGDLMGGMDFSKVNSEQRPFLPTIAEYAKSMLRGAATGSLDTLNSIQGLGEKMGFIPDTSKYMPDAAREQARQLMRDRIPEQTRKNTSDGEDDFFKQVGAFFGI